MPSLLELEEECNRMMMLKFGRMVDFEAVQERSVNINLEELEVEIMQKEYEHSQELKEWEVRSRNRKYIMIGNIFVSVILLGLHLLGLNSYANVFCEHIHVL